MPELVLPGARRARRFFRGAGSLGLAGTATILAQAALVRPGSASASGAKIRGLSGAKLTSRLTGRLEVFSFADLLQWMELNRRTGRLTLSAGRDRRVLDWREGEIVYVSGSLPRHRLGVHLLRSGALPAATLYELLARNFTSQENLTRLILDGGLRHARRPVAAGRGARPQAPLRDVRVARGAVRVRPGLPGAADPPHRALAARPGARVPGRQGARRQHAPTPPGAGAADAETRATFPFEAARGGRALLGPARADRSARSAPEEARELARPSTSSRGACGSAWRATSSCARSTRTRPRCSSSRSSASRRSTPRPSSPSRRSTRS